MKKLLFLFAVLFSVFTFSQDLSLDYKEYSYSQFFKMIEVEKDSIFKLKDALIIFNEKTDQRFAYKLNTSTNEVIDVDTTQRIVVDKRIELDNVQFKRTFGQRVSENVTEYKGSLYNIQFKKAFEISNSASFYIYNCIFNSRFLSSNFEICKVSIDLLRSKNLFPSIEIHNTTFNNLFVLNKNCRDKNSTLDIFIDISNSTFNALENSEDSRDQFFILSIASNRSISFNNNTLSLDEVFLYFKETSAISLNKNDFSYRNLTLTMEDQKGAVEILDNVFHDEVSFWIDGLKSQDQIDWSQFKNKLVSAVAKNNITSSLREEGVKRSYRRSKKFNKLYKDSIRYHNKTVYGSEVGLIGTFYNYYKSKYNTEVANEVYLELKDFETKRFEVLHKQNPTFKTYFTWKINQFLKIFSAYGTEPARAIVFSLYVILFFAFIYLLFPNSWDTLGNRRLMSRFEFFQKYLRQKEGMHTIYLEGKKEEISSYKDFKTNLENSKTELPSFFISWSKPLYNASMFSSKLTSRFLQNTDILKGKWTDLTPKQKRWKNIQIGLLLTLGLFYDLFIKALNALMLSINTFTTLGFGEIPIKGLPRYLAIIQGFIGWFMLTIFSVSLISQLLN